MLRPGETVYLLEKDGVLLGRMPLESVEMFAFHCTFAPTPEFEPYRDLFDTETEVGIQHSIDASEEWLERLITVSDEIQALGLTIRRLGGGIYRDAILHIDGQRADFCPLDIEEEPL